MRYGIFSDVHSNLEALEAVIAAYEQESIDLFLCVGDIVGYAANPMECIEKVNSLVRITVAGNHDWAAVDLFPVDYFNPSARQAIAWTRDVLTAQHKQYLESLKLTYTNEDLTLVHGTLYNPEEFNYMSDDYSVEESLGLLKTPVCFVGHSHVPGIFIADTEGELAFQHDACVLKAENKYIINVGSVGQPRDGDPRAAYCVFDTEKNEIHIKRVVYDMKRARQKILDAGLSESLGDRLLVGV